MNTVGIYRDRTHCREIAVLQENAKTITVTSLVEKWLRG